MKNFTPICFYNVDGGTTIDEACQEACSIARKENVIVKFTFNEIPLEAHSFTKPKYLQKEWKEADMKSGKTNMPAIKEQGIRVKTSNILRDDGCGLIEATQQLMDLFQSEVMACLPKPIANPTEWGKMVNYCRDRIECNLAHLFGDEEKVK